MAPPLVPVPLGVPLGCMAGEPDVAAPEPVAVGRSDDGAVVCASAGTATRAEASRHAVICVLSIDISSSSIDLLMRSPRPKRSSSAALRAVSQ
jgi:hypothetical protein